MRASGRTPTASTFLRVVEILERLMDSFEFFNLRDFDHRGTKVEHVSDEVSLIGVHDSELSWYANFIGEFTKISEGLFAERAVLSVDGEEVVVADSEGALDVVLSGPHSDGRADDFLAGYDAFFEGFDSVHGEGV